MKAGWETMTLEDICEIERGGSPRPIDSFLTDDPKGINWIKIGDTKGVTKYITATDQRIRSEGAKRSRMVYPGDFILSNSMSFGRPYIMKTTGCIHDGWLVLRQPKVDPDYLFLVLGSDLIFSQFDRLAAGSTVRNLNIGLVKGVKIPVPSMQEQKRIVTILDEIFEGIATARASAEKNIQNARGIFEGYLQAIFSERGEGWTEKSIQELVDEGVISKPQDGNHGEIHPTKADYTEVGVPFIMAADLDSGGVNTCDCRFISEAQARGLRVGFAKNDDVILSHKGTIGRAAILKTDEEFVIITPQVTYYRVLDKSRLYNEFLYYCFLNPAFQFEMNRIAGGGSTRAYIGITRQLELKISIPPIELQYKLATKFRVLDETTEQLSKVYARKLPPLDELKQSLLHRAFNGDL